ncbi:hypothetical protein [Myroides indicus]|uniref:Uncharacterized protein n=1 Tax=Myroides indicus TaxID=1323422 RepID=A0A4R7EV49_9FLAO|nr:hypothetical protein [Myroides indicus]TDS57559.1 hypothetical protein C8P70_11558 [Myroides indicus]
MKLVYIQSSTAYVYEKENEILDFVFLVGNYITAISYNQICRGWNKVDTL